MPVFTRNALATPCEKIIVNITFKLQLMVIKYWRRVRQVLKQLNTACSGVKYMNDYEHKYIISLLT